MSQFVDFDAFMQEQEEKVEPKKIKLFGTEYALPHELPAKALLLSVKMSKSTDNQEQTEAMSNLLTLFIGKDGTAAVYENGIGVTRLSELIRVIFAMYRGDEDPFAGLRSGNDQPKTATAAK